MHNICTGSKQPKAWDMLQAPKSSIKPDLRAINKLSSMQVTKPYLQAMDSIYAVSPTTVMLVEGTGQQSFPGINWGDGFVTQQDLLSKYYLSSSPTSFFQQLLSKPYLNNVAISPHVYPPSVTYQSTVSISGPCMPINLACSRLLPQLWVLSWAQGAVVEQHAG